MYHRFVSCSYHIYLWTIDTPSFRVFLFLFEYITLHYTTLDSAIRLSLFFLSFRFYFTLHGLPVVVELGIGFEQHILSYHCPFPSLHWQCHSSYDTSTIDVITRCPSNFRDAATLRPFACVPL
ncbi:hypothetical protein BKA70DRAFT_854836 [Coprinopsis sp. MPI-PUGE-AT-0042]|nr:hypothetical protein BKA70DRAFT_854836 [Coprinopsis sp. MPI-PUGE-AT-0042]